MPPQPLAGVTFLVNFHFLGQWPPPSQALVTLMYHGRLQGNYHSLIIKVPPLPPPLPPFEQHSFFNMAAERVWQHAKYSDGVWVWFAHQANTILRTSTNLSKWRSSFLVFQMFFQMFILGLGPTESTQMIFTSQNAGIPSLGSFHVSREAAGYPPPPL
jgi:hypothetical protein